MDPNEIAYLPIREMGALLRKGALSPVALTETLLERIGALDGALNAFRMVMRDRALAEARAAETALKAGADLGPLHGIPYGLKDLVDVKGYPTTAGWPKRENHRAGEDSSIVTRLARAGMVLLGKTNLVQFAYGGVGINHHHGTPRNPWNGREHCVPGGSSSGSGVAVASGMCPMAIGTDTGGSVRIPSALNGTVGLKTTVGRVTRHGVFPLSPTLDSIGPLTRGVEDAALVYEALHGPDPRDAVTWPFPVHDVLRALHDGVKGMRVAIPQSVFWNDLDAEVEKAVRETARVFRDLGAQVSEIAFSEAEEASQNSPRGLVLAAEAYTANQEAVDTQGDTLDPVIAFRIAKGKEALAWEYIRGLQSWVPLRERALATLRDVDVMITPATAIPAKPVRTVDQSIESYSSHNLLFLRNSTLGNVLNLCAVTLPCGFTRDGMPIGLTLYSKPFDEGTALRAAQAYERATDWHKRRPELGWAR